MTFEDFLRRAREVQKLDPTLHKQMASLYVDGGTLQQVVRAVLDLREDIQTRLSNTYMVDDSAVKVCIGLQGQVLGINNVLGLIHELMRQPEEETDEIKAP
jgi:hypothetical protein